MVPITGIECDRMRKKQNKSPAFANDKNRDLEVYLEWGTYQAHDLSQPVLKVKEFH